MKFGMDAEQFELLERIVIEPLQKLGATVFIFGSRARGVHHPFSDIDILYKVPPGIEIRSSDIAKIREDAEESRLTIKVDLVGDRDLVAAYRPGVERDMVLVAPP
jgi:predicted nucleotidyltransferase